MNEKLCKLYGNCFDACCKLVAGNDGVSWPLFMKVPDTYHSSAVKLMIVGQETRGWGKELNNPTSVEELMLFYDNFNLGKNYKRSPFWQAAQYFHGVINNNSPERSYLWSNLIKVCQHRKRPNAIVEEAICNLGLLQAEIEITKPSVVVFFTGPSYDHRLASTFPGLSFDSSSRRLSRVIHPRLPWHSYRTYHPNYLRRSKSNWMVLDEIKDLVTG